MYNIEKTKKGLNVININQGNTNTVTVLVIVGTGSKYETKKNNGISHFVEHMVFKGAKKRKNALAITFALDAVGADFNAFTSKEYTGYWIKAEPRKLDLILDVLSDMLLYSRLDAKEINREKGVIVEELNMYLDNPMMNIDNVFEECVYGDIPAGWSTLGTRENILNFKRRDFVDYISSQYRPDNTFFCVVGNSGLNMATINTKIDKYFATPEMMNNKLVFAEKEPVEVMQEEKKIKIVYKETDQAHLCLGVPAYDYIHKDRMAAKLLAIILGGSMSSRLFISLREKNGLAYYVSTMCEAYTDSGYVTSCAGVKVDNIDKAIAIILAEYKNMRNKLVGRDELQKAKDMLRGKVNIRMESSDNLANWYAEQAVMMNAIGRGVESGKKREKFCSLSTPDEYLKEINKVTAADIKRVAQNIFKTEKLNLAIIGPFKDGKRFEKGLEVESRK